MKYRSHKIILMVTAGILLSFSVASVASAKNFTIFNATNANIPYFSVNGTSGNVGIGITNPATLLQILNNGWISAKNNAGTGVVNMFKVNAFDQIEVGAPLNIGSFEFSPDSGLVTFVDMPVTASAASGTVESYVFKLDGDNMMSIYAESNGVGGIQNKRVGIGKTNPLVNLDVIGSGSFTGTVGGTGLCMGSDCRVSWSDIVAGGGGNLWAGTTSSAIYSNNGNFNVGIGTSLPAQKLDVFGIIRTTRSAALPSYYTELQFDGIRSYGVGDMYISQTANNNMLFLTNNSEAMRILNGGNVGIGTTNPGTKLDVNGYLRATGAAITTVTNGIVMADGSGNLYATSSLVATGLPSPVGITGQTLRSNGTNWVANSLLFNDGTNVGIGTTVPSAKFQVYSTAPNTPGLRFTTKGGGTAGDMMFIGEDDGAGGQISFGASSITYNGSNYPITLTSNHANRQPGIMEYRASTVDSSSGFFFGTAPAGTTQNITWNLVALKSGNVGVGKVALGANLDVLTSINAGSTVTATGFCIGSVCKSDWSQITGTNVWGGATTSDIWSNNGAFNVGIGKTNPGFKLDVAGIINATALYVNGTPYIGSQWTTNGTSVYYNTGNVGIGISAPTVALSVLGAGNFTGTVNGSGLCIAGDCKVSWDAVVAAGGGNLWSGTSTGVIWSANGANNVGVGTTAPTAKLDVAGDLKIGDTAGVCNASKKGGMRYNSTSRQTYLCDGVKWKNMNNCGIITDADGNLYGTVQIGGQCWMAENMNVGVKLASGATLPNTNDTVVEKWCYNNSDANCTTYGGLYSWLEATRGSKTASARGICPNGWHIPTDREFNDLEQNVIATIDSGATQFVCDFNTIIPRTYYWRRCADDSGTDAGGTLGAGKSLKEIGQGTGNGAGDDLVGFALKLNGARNATNNAFEVLGSYAYMWSSTLTYDTGTSQVYAWYRVFKEDYTTIDRGMDLQSYGFAVRCVRD